MKITYILKTGVIYLDGHIGLGVVGSRGSFITLVILETIETYF